ncbi:MAG: DUF1566 domain-containing protein [Sandaracinaceae bacterium]
MKNQLCFVSGIASILLATGCLDDHGGGCSEMAECSEREICTSDVEAGEGTCVAAEHVDAGDVFMDPSTGLEWQVTPFDADMDWASAVAHCEQLELDGTGWRLPTIGELRSLIRGCAGTETGGRCAISDTCLSFETCEIAGCEGCALDVGPSDGCYWPAELEGDCERFYWSGSTIEEVDDRTFYIIFSFAHMSVRSKNFFFGQARCVR